MNDCPSTTEVAGVVVRCDREHGHGGAHQATIDDPVRDPDFTYLVSWWPTAAALSALDGDEGTA